VSYTFGKKSLTRYSNVVCRRELEQLIAEQRRAAELAVEKEEELYRLHESRLAEIAAQQNRLAQLKAQHEAERDAAWRDIAVQRQMLEQQRAGGQSEFHVAYRQWCKALVTTAIRLEFECRLTPI